MNSSRQNEVEKLKKEKVLLEQISQEENDLAEICTISLIEKLLNVKITPTLGYVIENDNDSVPSILLKDVDTLNIEFKSMSKDIDAVFENGFLKEEAYLEMKMTLKKVYDRFKKKAPKFDGKKIDIRKSKDEFEEYVIVKKQNVTPLRTRRLTHVEFVKYQKPEMRINRLLEEQTAEERMKEFERRSKELGLSKNNFDYVVKKEMKLHKAI